LIAALVGGFGVAIYNNRHNTRIEQERNAAQLELERKRFELEQERIRFQAQMEAEKAKEAMQRARTTAEREQAYRDLLQADPRIARMQILGIFQTEVCDGTRFS
jgi:hypothetical protein